MGSDYSSYINHVTGLSFKYPQFYIFSIYDKEYLIRLEGDEFEEVSEKYFNEYKDFLMAFLKFVENQELFEETKGEEGYKTLPVRVIDIRSYNKLNKKIIPKTNP